jgi:ribonuclease D
MPVRDTNALPAAGTATLRPATTPQVRPTKDEIALLHTFESLPRDRIHLIKNSKQANVALQVLTAARYIGFDTESKPVFEADAARSGPHVIQFSTLEDAFILQVNASTPVNFLKQILESSAIVKVGFGLKSDRGPLRRKFGIQLNEVVDLSHVIRKLGYQDAVGIKTAVAIVLSQQLRKSKKVTTSNWALPELTESQITYAADDAYAALKIFHAMGLVSTYETRATMNRATVHAKTAE